MFVDNVSAIMDKFILIFCFIFFQGWVSNVAPWLVSIPSSIFAGYLSGQLVKSGIAPGKARKLIFVSITLNVYSWGDSYDDCVTVSVKIYLVG